MKKIAIFVSAMLFSMSSTASMTSQLHTSINHILQNNFAKHHDARSLIYGGQDLSRSQIATANENFITHQLLLMG